VLRKRKRPPPPKMSERGRFLFAICVLTNQLYIRPMAPERGVVPNSETQPRPLAGLFVEWRTGEESNLRIRPCTVGAYPLDHPSITRSLIIVS
jgi:hypothetical protein